MAASSRSWRASVARVCAACVAGAGDGVLLLLLGEGGKSSRTRRSFMWGTADVPTARRVRSVGQRASAEGEKAIHALLCGARFCVPEGVRAGEGDGDVGVRMK